MGWERRYDFSGQDHLGFADAAAMLNELGDLDQLEQMMRGASSPGALAEVDIDRARELLGDDAARSLEPLAKVTQQLEEAGLIHNKEGRPALTPQGLRKNGRNAPYDLFSKLARDKPGRPQVTRPGTRPPRRGCGRSSATRSPTSSRSWRATSSAATRWSAAASVTSAPTTRRPTSSATRSTCRSSARCATPSVAPVAARPCGSRPTTSRSSRPSRWCAAPPC